ncbi:hypothetical protein E5P55_01010 [Candidatus Pinguicoccus supinus]|uniref:DNA-directed RNA polymerase insert domain-containing protein n=1 Tax=Candidatus Pinguicoccus supinus TaxID=2529394 RepID=A0A7T0BRI4_9BACT|nr:hypothetical protein E5P55_01010 [Candidatus Pinguicoccus supinus]
MEGIRHEFQYLEGVVEDVPTILLNLKKCLVIYTKFKAVTLKSKVLKKGLVLAKDLIKTDIITLVNPNLKIFTITKNINLNFTIHLSVGRGF